MTEDIKDTKLRNLGLISGALVQPYEYRVIDKSGKLKWVMETISLVDYEEERAILGYCIDITERKQAEEALFKSEAKYKEMAESITDLFFAMDDKLRYTYWNKASEIITGIPSEDALGKHLHDIFPRSKASKQAERVYIKALKTKKPQQFVNPFRLNGKDRVFEITAYPTLDGISVFAKDITERKRLEKKVGEIEELNKLKSDILSTVSHELRTPLATIKGYSTMMLEYDKRLAPAEKLNYLKSIDKATDRLTELVEHLLDMSRLEAGLLKMDMQQVNFLDIVTATIDDSCFIHATHKIILDIVGILPDLTIDAYRIRQVIENLIDNACKYSETGTEVIVTICQKESELQISITDQGIGIPANELEMVFDRMYRIKQRLSQDPGGMGLGLALCKALVEAHEGRIWIESEQGKGSCCSFTLPL